MFLTFERMLF